MKYAQEKFEIHSTMKRLDQLGMVSGSSGNASIRIDDQTFVVTPAGVTYDALNPEDMVVVDQDLEPMDGDGIPSSESLLHLAIYAARPDVSAIIHTHSVYASVHAVTGQSIPPIIDEAILYIGGQIDVSEYGVPGSQELADYGVAALGDKRAAIIRNHGMFAVADTLKEALRVAELVERVAKIHIEATNLGGAIPIPEEGYKIQRNTYLMRAGIPPED